MNPSIFASEILVSFRVFRGQMDFQAVEAWQPPDDGAIDPQI
jgi:hypothetical protein